MAFVFVADDFTGASDTLATLARGGLRTRLFRDPPAPADRDGLDAWGIATNARSLDTRDIAALAARIGEGLAPARPEFLHVKICSTFDSSARIGNVALFAQGLAKALGIGDLAVLAGQPSLGRYAVFGTLFARGPDGDIHRIDRHPVMAAHPVTPMHEADLVRHLATLGLQGLHRVGRGEAGGAFPRLYDLLDPSDVAQAGADLARSGRRLVVLGSSSVAEAWLSVQPPQRPLPPGPVAAEGAVLAFAGSRSSLTMAQIGAAQGWARLPVSPMAMMGGGADLQEALTWAITQLGQQRDCLLYLAAEAHPGILPADLARHCADFVQRVLAAVQPAGLIVAGGDTSSAIVNSLAPKWLDFACDLCPGVPILRTEVQGAHLLLALKGGQMGSIDFFSHAAAVMRGGHSAPGQGADRRSLRRRSEP